MGSSWLFSQLWEELGLREFWQEHLGVSREGTDWEHVLQLLSAKRLFDPWQNRLVISRFVESGGRSPRRCRRECHLESGAA